MSVLEEMHIDHKVQKKKYNKTLNVQTNFKVVFHINVIEKTINKLFKYMAILFIFKQSLLYYNNFSKWKIKFYFLCIPVNENVTNKTKNTPDYVFFLYLFVFCLHNLFT